jgi:hypothetical protein
VIDVNAHDRFVVTRRRRVGASPSRSVDVYEFALGDAGAEEPAVCHVRQRVARFDTRIGFYADEARTVPLMHLNARPRFDPWGRYELTDASLRTIGAIQKAFMPRSRRSRYVLFGGDGDEVATVEAQVKAALARRRVGRIGVVAAAGALGIPFIGAAGVVAAVPVAVATAARQVRDWVDPIDVATELRVLRGDELLGVFLRLATGGPAGPAAPPLPWGGTTSAYDIDMTADAGRTMDRRLVLAVPVALDALRGVIADPGLR